MSFKGSRLIVKNLGKNVTAEEIRNLFSKKGTVTDLRLKYKKDGTFRHFAFVGYKTSDEAKRALKAFKNVRLGDANIDVELCSTVRQFYVKPGAEICDEDSDHEEKVWGSIELVHQHEDQEQKLNVKFPKREKAEHLIEKSRRIFIRNLCFTCTAKNIRKLFKDYGPLEEVYMPLDPINPEKNKGIAFVSFLHSSKAVKAYKTLDGTDFQGRVLHLIPGHNRISRIVKGIPPNEDVADDLESEEMPKSSIQNRRELDLHLNSDQRLRNETFDTLFKKIDNNPYES